MKPAVKKALHTLRIRTEGVPDVGSKEWYWDMRIRCIPLWFLPVMPPLYALAVSEPGSPTWLLVLTLGPWALAGIALLFATRALWRVMVNVEGNSTRPFTKKDHKALHLAQAVTTGPLVFLLAVLLFGLVDRGTVAQRAAVDGAINGSIVLLFTVSGLMTVTTRMHDKGKQGYDELEKGV